MEIDRDMDKLVALIRYLDDPDVERDAKIAEIKHARDCELITGNEAIYLVIEMC